MGVGWKHTVSGLRWVHTNAPIPPSSETLRMAPYTVPHSVAMDQTTSSLLREGEGEGGLGFVKWGC